ncbi:MAG: ATP-binding protein [Desulfovermiculus sp.]|nr:ATP-binding protein [Desulfovermiculus sp.]
MTHNPFSLGSTDIPLCDRQTELKTFIRLAQNRQNVLVYGSRRLGKTMLIKEVQEHLASEGFIVVFCDLFGVVSIEDISARICRALFEVTHKQEPLHKKAIRALTTFRPTMRPTNDGLEFSFSVEKTSSDMGIDVLEQTFKDLTTFVNKTQAKMHIVFDEFQEITEVEEGVQIQGVMRKHIQNMSASFFFVGSRKRILSQMFHDRSKPFFQSTFDYELGALPKNECTIYIQDQFQFGGKSIGDNEAQLIYSLISGNPYYMQKICHILFDEVQDGVENEEDVYLALKHLLESEKGYFETTMDALTPKQKALMRALAREWTQSLYSQEYITKHNLGSLGGIQHSIDTLSKKDLLMKENNTWRIIDPVLEIWLKEKFF